MALHGSCHRLNWALQRRWLLSGLQLAAGGLVEKASVREERKLVSVLHTVSLQLLTFQLLASGLSLLAMQLRTVHVSL